jgi:hypothetical protein
LQDVRRRSQSNEEEQDMRKGMIKTEGEITAIHRGGERYAEG